MKLRPKRQIDAEVATQRKHQIDEGVQLAQKIDVLRETQLKEEGNLERFRRETIAFAQTEIDAAIAKRDKIQRESLEAEERRRVALIPLDAERRKIDEGNKTLEAAHEELKVQRRKFVDETKASQKRIEKITASLISKEKKLDDREERLTKWSREMEIKDGVITTRMANLAEAENYQRIELDTRTKDVKQRELSVAHRETGISSREESVEKKEKEQREKEINLISRYKALDSAILEMQRKYPKLSL